MFCDFVLPIEEYFEFMERLRAKQIEYDYPLLFKNYYVLKITFFENLILQNYCS